MSSGQRLIPFNKPFLSGKETEYILKAVASGKISGNGAFTRKCQDWLEKQFRFNKVLLTSSCTDALEMSALLLNIAPGDEVIAPSFTFVSTVNAFVLRGARIVFADSCSDHPNMDIAAIETLISPRTKAIVCMHYGGVACEMDRLLEIAGRHGIPVVEDAAHAINSRYKGKRYLGSIGDFGTFSFHETKNIISGEGGALVINKTEAVSRAEIIWEKGTNRTAFHRGETSHYNWVDIGSSFLPSDMTAAFLYAQLELLDMIQERRLLLWNLYAKLLQPLADEGFLRLPFIPEYAENNAHLFYLLCNSAEERTGLLTFLNQHGINAVFHYLPLHQGPYYEAVSKKVSLPNAERFSSCLLRLPMFYELSEDQVAFICAAVSEFFRGKAAGTHTPSAV